jgi:hypothetical protein
LKHWSKAESAKRPVRYLSLREIKKRMETQYTEMAEDEGVGIDEPSIVREFEKAVEQLFGYNSS